MEPIRIMARFARLLRGRLLSPLHFLAWAGASALAFTAVELAGWRECTTFLSGTATSVHSDYAALVLRGSLYLLAYFSFVLVAPILVLAAGILALYSRLRRRP